MYVVDVIHRASIIKVLCHSGFLVVLEPTSKSFMHCTFV